MANYFTELIIVHSEEAFDFDNDFHEVGCRIFAAECFACKGVSDFLATDLIFLNTQEGNPFYYLNHHCLLILPKND